MTTQGKMDDEQPKNFWKKQPKTQGELLKLLNLEHTLDDDFLPCKELKKIGKKTK